MELRKIASKKPLKLLTLLLTAMLIATASAAVYYSLTLRPQVTVTGLTVKFDGAADTSSGSNVNDAWTLLALKSYPNVTLTYDRVVDINNTDGSAHGILLRHVSISPNNTAEAGNWTSITFYLYDENGTLKESMSYTQSLDVWTVTPTQTSSYSVPGSAVWYLKVETLSPATAETGKVLNIEIAVDVQE